MLLQADESIHGVEVGCWCGLHLHLSIKADFSVDTISNVNAHDRIFGH